ncbi:MAG: M48 family metallopeptidase [Pseudomonadales bacterium]|nr:M48 family metallopeptidase [Pseudomonadales bacterium]
MPTDTRQHSRGARRPAPEPSLQQTLGPGQWAPRILLTLLLAVTTPAAGNVADQLPALGDASSSLISPALEREIGQQFMKQIRGALPTVDDPILRYWIEVHLADLAQHAQLRDSSLQVVVIDNRDLNAFAAPGGVVGVNLGLLLQAEDVHEYSSVMAHELAHLSQRHFARGIEEQRAQSIPTIASLLAAILVGAMGGADAGLAAITAAQAAAQSSQLRYSRGREQEADRIGLTTLIRAGYDPNGMARMFERMQRTYRFTSRPPEFLLTHPLSESRIADARQGAQAYDTARFPDQPEFGMMRARALVRYAETPQAAVATFERAVRDDPDSEVARYGLALALSRAEAHGQAIALGDALFSSSPERILPLASYAELLINAGQYAQAERLLERGLALNPDNAPLGMLHARTLTKAQRYDDAVAALTRQSILRSEDIDVWYQLAEVSGLAGNIVGVHRARAEFFALRGAYERAIQHLEYARRLADRTDSPLIARLDQRLDDFRTALRQARS